MLMYMTVGSRRLMLTCFYPAARNDNEKVPLPFDWRKQETNMKAENGYTVWKLKSVKSATLETAIA